MSKTRIVVYTLVLCLAVGVGLAVRILPRLSPPKEAPVTGAVGVRPPEVAVAQPGLLLKKSPEEIIASVAATYRLAPDRRFVGALTMLDGVLAVPGDPRPTVRFVDGKWEFEVHGEKLGVLDEFPDFPDLYGIVARYAAKVVSARGATLGIAAGGKELVQLPGEDPTAWLRRIDAAWQKGPANTGLVRSAARAYASVVLQQSDHTGVATSVGTRGLAILALAEALGAPMPSERALVAALWGYDEAALDIGRTLPANDPVRALASGEVATLHALAKRPDASRTAQLLAMEASKRYEPRAAQEQLLRDLPEAFRESLPGLGHQAYFDWGTFGEWRLALGTIADLRSVLGVAEGSSLSQQANATLEAFIDGLTRALGGTGYLARLDSLLDRLAKEERGFFFDASTEASYYRGFLFTAMDSMLRWALHTFGSTDRARHFSKLFGSGESAASKAFERYVAHLIAADDRALSMRELVADIRELHELGVDAVVKLYAAIPERGLVDPVLLQATAALAARCDTRPECIGQMRYAAWGPLMDVTLAERLGRVLHERYPQADPSTLLWYLELAGDKKGFLASLDDARISPAARATAIREAKRLLTPDEQKAAFERLTEREPADASVAEKYLMWLDEDRAEPKEARAVAKRWLDAPGEKHPLTVVFISTLAARELQKSGDVEGAWAEVEPLIGSWHASPMMRGALVLSALGRHEDAIALAQRRYQRYRGVDSLGLLAQMHWRAGRYEDAAATFARGPQRPALTEWTWMIAERFFLAFHDKPVGDAKRAFGAMIAANLDPLGLRGVATTRYLKPEFAFELHSLLPAQGFLRHRDACQRYRYLREWKGEAAANAWIKGQFTGSDAEPLSQFAYEAGLFDLEFDVLDDPGPKHPFPSFAWLMRAASYLRGNMDRPERRARMEAHYAQQHEHLHDRLGMYLLGLGDAESAWSRAGGVDGRTEALYYMAVKAQHDRDIPRAIALYRAINEGSSFREGEFGWARDQLWHWRDRHQSVERLAADRAADGFEQNKAD